MVAADVFWVAIAVVMLPVITTLLSVTSAPEGVLLSTLFTVAVVFAVRDLSSRTNASTVELVTAVGVVVTVCAETGAAANVTETDPRTRALAP
jgi:methylase of polypeptide subunit release factors